MLLAFLLWWHLPLLLSSAPISPGGTVFLQSPPSPWCSVGHVSLNGCPQDRVEVGRMRPCLFSAQCPRGPCGEPPAALGGSRALAGAQTRPPWRRGRGASTWAQTGGLSRPLPRPELCVQGPGLRVGLRVGVWHGAGSGHPQERASPWAVRGPPLQTWTSLSSCQGQRVSPGSAPAGARTE